MSKKVTITFFLVVFVICATTVAFMAMNKEDKKEPKKEEPETPVVEEPGVDYTNPDTNYVLNDKDDFILSFMQMEENKQNMIYSPLSIKYAFKMLEEGAGGDTYEELHALLGELELTKYENIDKRLSLANAMFIKNTHKNKISKDYTDTLKDKYNASVVYDNFDNADNVNKWIEDNTLGIIKKMLRNDDLKNTHALLINALAIDMEWARPFDAKDTYGADFYLTSGNKMTATTMHTETSSDAVSYYIDDDVTVLGLDLKEYKDKQFEFVAIMPNKESIDEYAKKLTVSDLNKILDSRKTADKEKYGLSIYLPRFKFSYDLNLVEDMKVLGVKTAFDEVSANFEKIARDFYVSGAKHKADIEISEKGLKAAAATVIMMTESTAFEENYPVLVKVDHPFIFVIRDKETNEVWFVGQVTEPCKWEDDKDNYKREY